MRTHQPSPTPVTPPAVEPALIPESLSRRGFLRAAALTGGGLAAASIAACAPGAAPVWTFSPSKSDDPNAPAPSASAMAAASPAVSHEAGHSMHTWHSSRHQPYQYYGYVIFVAEVASTFNEELLSHHLLKSARDDRQRAYLINRELDDIRATIVRQTMFAEFEKITHEMAEAGEGRAEAGRLYVELVALERLLDSRFRNPKADQAEPG